jgi:D-proline reductase (dithiol) PrdB
MPRPPVDYIERTREQYSALGYPPYQWVESDTPPPWAPLGKPLADCTVGLIGSGGIYRSGQVAFHYRDDLSFRIIDTHEPTSQLRATHFAYDLTDARRDPNVVFPIDTLQALAAEGSIGGLAERAYAFMGGIYSSRKVRERLAPELADRVVRDAVDVVLMVPV